MLTPEELLELVETMQPVLDDLNTWITKDLIRRFMARMEGTDLHMTNTDTWQVQLYQEAGGHVAELQREIADFTELAEDEVRRIFEDAGIRAYAADCLVYAAAGLQVAELADNERMLRILQDTYERTNGEIFNFTRTTAQQSQKRLMKALDNAHMKVITGAQSYTAAVKEAVEELAKGQAEVVYPTGHVDTLETAVLRAVRTGTAQAGGNMALQGMIDHDWDIILVSAHLGARYGDGGPNPGNHHWWQGKFYSRTGATPHLPDFIEATGYGTGEGLSGWNCRHSFGPGDGVHNPYTAFDAEENRKAYDLSQKQRQMERAIRKTKRELLGYREAIKNCTDPVTKEALQWEYDKTADKLSKQNAAYKDFCKTNDLKPYDDRLHTAKWNREEASEAVRAAKQYKKALDALEKQATKEYNDKIEAVRRMIKSDEMPKTLNRGNQNKHIKGSKGYIQGKSYIYGDLAEAQKLVDQYHGTGQPVFTRKGDWNNKEVVLSESVMGVNVTPDGVESETRRFVIHYSKKGTHVVPTKEIEE